MYVCKTLSSPSENQIQTCVEWVSYSPVLPDISTQEAGQIATSIALVLVLAWGFKKIASLIK